VLCARSGVVVEVAGHFTRGGLDDALRHKANFVCIRHHDSYSRYFHLKSVCVRVGQTCAVGDELGRSGNTGYSTGPHLHFDVVDMNPTHVFELELCPGDAAVRCVPFSFSSRRVPEPGVAFPMVFAQPLDLSRNVSGPAGCALVCERGGEPSFREKATRADAALAALLIVVDNDDAMLDVLPPLVGDQRPEAVTECWAVFVAKCVIIAPPPPPARSNLPAAFTCGIQRTHWPALQQASAVSIRLISGVSPLVLTRRTDCFTPQSLPVNFTY